MKTFSCRPVHHFAAGVAIAAFALANALPMLAQSFDVTYNFRFECIHPSSSLIQGSDGRLYGTARDGVENTRSATGAGMLFAVNPDGTGFTVLRHLDQGPDGSYPEAALLQGSDGRLYGTTSWGGAYGVGTLFAINPDGTGFTVLRSLNRSSDGYRPVAALMQGSDGRLYGTAPQGGAHDRGALFAVNPDGSGFTLLHSLTSYSDTLAALVQGSDGRLYGTVPRGGAASAGALFAVNPDGSDFTVLHSLNGSTDGYWPVAALMQGSDGRLYGTTSRGGAYGGGTLVAINPDGGGFTVLYSLNRSLDGANPMGALVQGSDGRLYGTAQTGGAADAGTVFAVNPDGSGFTVLHSLTSSSDGANPLAALVQGSNGRLYGTARNGGVSSIITETFGTVFAVDPDGSDFTVLHFFNSLDDGAFPRAALIEGSNGRFYGTTERGSGYCFAGTLFAINPDGSDFTLLHSLFPSGFLFPRAALLQGSDGRLYGTSYRGWFGNPFGTLFTLSSDGTGFAVLSNLGGFAGAWPEAPLVQGSDGRLYGTTTVGGPAYAGTLFAINPDGSGFSVLRDLASPSDGASPRAALLQATDGRLYGTAREGGAYGAGTVFAINPNGAGFTVLRNLISLSDGGNPMAALVQGSDGRLYGTTSTGGAASGGTLFAINSDGSNFTVLRSLIGPSDGANPMAALVQGPDGRLYGTAQTGGATNAGTVFALSPDGTGFTVLRHLIRPSDGASPRAALLQASDGRLYGTTERGGRYDAGTIFVLTLPPTITSVSSASSTYGQNFEYTIAATNSPTSFAATALPPGLTLNATSGLISGTATAAGTYVATINATNDAGTASVDLTITIATATATVSITDTAQSYDGSPKPVTVITAPAGLATSVTYDGSATPPTVVGSYAVVATIDDPNYEGSASDTLVVAQAPATVTLGDLNPTYDGTPKTVTTTTVPPAVAVAITYDGSTTAPTHAGSYAIVATVTDPNYLGSATGTLTIEIAPAIVMLGGLNVVYDAAPHAVIVTTDPAGLNVVVTYDGSTTAPTDPGIHAVSATIVEANYFGSATGTLTIANATAGLVMGDLTQPYDGTPRIVSVTTDPAGLTVDVTYNGSATPPVAPGSYAVSAIVNEANYVGSASGTLLVTTTVLVRHAPTLNGGIDGSIQVLLPENTTLNGSAWVSGDLLVPGTPTVRLNGNPTYGGTLDGSGVASPSNYTITLNGGVALRHVVRRTNPVAYPTVSAPPAPAGTRNVVLNSAGQSPGAFATLRNLTLNGNVGQIAVPAGTYGTFTANGKSGFTLGVANTSTPAIYNLQGFTLNGATKLEIVGPVILNVGSNVNVNGTVGASGNPEWLLLMISSGGLTLNGNGTFNGFVVAPSGTVIVNGSSTLNGGVTSDRLTINGTGLISAVE